MGCAVQVPRCRVFIVDDHPVVLSGVRNMLAVDAAISVVGEATSVAAALEACDRQHVDIVLTDLGLGDRSGFHLARTVRVRHPLTKVVLYSMHDPQMCARWALELGASGYIHKSAEPSTLRQAVLDAWRGELAFSPSVRDWLVRLRHGAQAPRTHRLSEREFSVFSLLGRGLSTQQIAGRLEAKPATVDSHNRKIQRKLGLQHHDALIRLATLVFGLDTRETSGVRHDRARLRAFESATLPQPDWTHRAHLEVAFNYLSRLPFSTARKCLRDGIRRLNASHGNVGGYHETITIAFARVIRSRIEAEPLWLHSADFIEAHPGLVEPDALAPLGPHYTRELLLSPAARESFVEPDRAPLPDVSEHI